MAQSLSFLLVHMVFSTKDRRPVLNEEIRPELFAYMATVLRDHGCECYRVGGVADHVHFAVRVPATQNVADLIREIKSLSSKWLKVRIPGFGWQRGYGAFSVSASGREALLQYIDRQEEHHRKLSFQDEFRAFLEKHGIEFDERYIWG